MKALRWHGRNDVRLDEVPQPPPPGAGHVQLKVLACGICGTDIEEIRSGPIFIPVGQPHPLTGGVAPLTLGHEFCGEVVAIGPGVTGVSVGDRLAVDGLVFCGECYWCRRGRVNLCETLGAVGLMSDGGLAEYANVPFLTSAPIPPHVRPEAAALAETLSVAIRALRRGRIEPGQQVAIVGAGTVGLLALQAALVMGASRVVVVDPSEPRLECASALGAVGAWTPDATPQSAIADLVLECSGNPDAIAAATRLARKGGTVVLVGIYAHPAHIDGSRIVENELDLVGSLSHVFNQDFALAIRLLSAGAIQTAPLISDRLSLDQALTSGFGDLALHPESHLKIVVFPNGIQ